MACSSSSGSSREVCAVRRFVLILIAASALAACGREPLYGELEEQQVNEMLAVLVASGLDAAKVRSEKGWSLEVDRDDLPQAMAVLKAEGYPRERYDSLGQVFRKEGFVSTPLEERARLLYALSQELSRTVSSIDGVVVARVHLAIPERRPLSDEKPLSSASVFIKYKPGSQVVNKTAAIKALVVNSVEGLPYDNVTVTFFATEAAPRVAGNRS
jgi:type III secretion protein J